MNQIEKFIALFGNDDRYMNGLCYWFVYILKGRFPSGEIWYDQIENHFYYVMDDVTYDVRGKVVLPSTAMRWSGYEVYDELDYQRVVKYCILKEGD